MLVRNLPIRINHYWRDWNLPHWMPLGTFDHAHDAVIMFLLESKSKIGVNRNGDARWVKHSIIKMHFKVSPG